jgi:hypothetical protein
MSNTSKWGYPTEFADLTQNKNKMAEIPNRKFSRIKYVYYFRSKNELKICIVATRLKILKKIIGTPNQPIRPKNFPKKYV